MIMTALVNLEKSILSEVCPAGEAWMCEVKKGQYFRIVDLAQRVIRRGLEGMIHGYGVFRILREGHLGHGGAEPEQGNAK